MRASLLIVAGCAGWLLPQIPAQTRSPYDSAAAYVQQSRNELAIPILQKLVAGSPQDLKARNLLGIALLNLGRREQAAAQFRRAWEIDTTFYPALKNLALAELALGRRTESRAHFEQVLKLKQDDPVAHLNLAEMDYADHRYLAALAHYQRSGGLFLKDRPATLRAMRAAIAGGNPKAAIEIGEPLGQSVEVLRVLAEAYEQAGDTQRAYDALRIASRVNPDDEAVYLDLMALCVEHQTWDLAIQVSDAALGRVPQSFRVRVQRGAVFALKGEVETAEREFAEAARIAPHEVAPQVSLALARVQLNRVPEAIAGLRACRAEHPKDYVVNWILGETLSQAEDSGEALPLLEEAVRLAPREAAPRVLLGKLLAKRGELKRAALELEAAVKLQPDDVSAQYVLATIYRKAGNLKRADELFEKVGNARIDSPEDTAKRSMREVTRRSGR
jgi:tetratricopeptide (TPR) repeat protein